LTPDTDTLLLKEGESIVGLIQIKMVDNTIFISNFCSIKKGAGSTLLNKVIEISKQLKKDIALTYDEFGENPESLVKYYETYGFVNTNGNNMVLKSKGGTRKSRR
jgi:predicted enzyme involved in methoxymalonyl-ACP biosynthesis